MPNFALGLCNMGLILLCIFGVAVAVMMVITGILIFLFKPKGIMALSIGIVATILTMLFCYLSITNIVDPGSSARGIEQLTLYVVVFAFSPCIGTVVAIVISRIYGKTN